jgi:hypothetical protein
VFRLSLLLAAVDAAARCAREAHARRADGHRRFTWAPPRRGGCGSSRPRC